MHNIKRIGIARDLAMIRRQGAAPWAGRYPIESEMVEYLKRLKAIPLLINDNIPDEIRYYFQ